ncbi:MAG: hypothetical protein RIR51_1262 [Bacteroidota bacterium]|jgi:sugar phosphate isomerase/epimerase
MNRRLFLEKTTIAGLSLTSLNSCKSGSLFENIGINLFSLPKVLEANFERGIEMLSKMGYKEIEMYGPYSFSDEKAKKRWDSLEPLVGFNGSGFFNKNTNEILSIMNSFGLKVPSLHTDLDTLSNGMGKLAEAANILGSSYLVLPAIPDEERQNLDAYKRIAERFNKIGEDAKNNGLKFAYHNHGYGLSVMEGKIPIHLILDETDKNLVFFEMDLFWTTAGRMDPIELLKNNSGRYHLMHVKDMKKLVHFSGDGGTANQWTELWGEMTTAGDGVLDLPNILKVAKENGLKHCIVEQDIVEEPEIALQRSINYLSSLK